MAIPSGSGTEVLKRFTRNVLNGATVAFTTVPANHIYVILLINISSAAGSSSHFGIHINDGSNDINIITQNAGGTLIPAYQSFVYNEKLVMTAGDALSVAFGGDYAEVWVSYIDQDWT